jgi:hypothetical protein
VLHEETVERGTLDLIIALSKDDQLSQFNLVGGTALSLQIGHRISVDIDLFIDKPFDSNQLANHLINNFGAYETVVIKNGVFCYINNVKVDILTHQDSWLKMPTVEKGIRLASLDDIAAMKFNAIVGDGSRVKDFIDIYMLLEHRTLNQMTYAYESKYRSINARVARKALLYHKDVAGPLHYEVQTPIPPTYE